MCRISLFSLLFMIVASSLWGGGRIAGQVKLRGNFPKPKSISVIYDKSKCGLNRQQSSVRFSQKMEIQDVVVFLEGPVAGGKKFSADTSPILDQSGCEFVPHIVFVPVQEKLSIKNEDHLEHKLRLTSRLNPPLELVQRNNGKPLVLSFERSEFFEIQCSRHRWMNAWVVVMGHPYYTLTNQSGRYELQDIPVGEYDLVAWHESLGQLRKRVVVREDQTTSLDLLYVAK